MRAFFTCVIVLLLCIRPGYAQELRDTLKPVVKRSERRIRRHNTDVGIKQLSVDSAVLSTYKNQTIATLLAQQLPVFVRTYGTNGLATLSLRGASAAQTAVQWNHVPMQSGSTGLVDLMLIPVSVVDEVTVAYGSNGGYVGSGAVGGVLYLQHKAPEFKDAHDYSLFGSTGSFGRYQGGIRLNQSTRKWDVAIVATAQKTDNNFEYTNNAGNKEQLSNAAVHSGNIQADLAYKISDKSRLSAAIWFNKSTREIPPALFESTSVKKQDDAALRTVLSWLKEQGKNKYEITGSLIDEWFRYNDSASTINSDLHSRQLFLNLSATRKLTDKLTATVFIPVQYNYLMAAPDKNIAKTALAAMLSVQHHKLSFSANGRAELVNGKLYGAGGGNLGYDVWSSLKLKGSLGYAYRLPTLNELYYTPGGNPNLLPEKGWSAEAGYTWQPATGSTLKLTHSTTAFYRDMHNWIIWFGGAIWTPHNIAQVASKGIETENKLVWSRPKASWQLSANASYISSKTTKSAIAGDGSVGCQIPYAPRIIGQGNIGFNNARFRINYNHTYTGLRYFNTDESGDLPAFNTGNIQAGYLLQRGDWSYDLSLQVQNVWNNRYAEVAFRPAPGINWLLGIVVRNQ